MEFLVLQLKFYHILRIENIKIFNGVMEKNKEIELDASFFNYKKDIKIKLTLVYDTEFDYLQKGSTLNQI